MYISLPPPNPFIASIDGFLNQDRLKILIGSIACSVIFTAVTYLICSRFWGNRKMIPVKAVPQAQNGSPGFKYEQMKSPAHSENKDKKPFITHVLDEAYNEIKNLKQQLHKTQQSADQTQAELKKVKEAEARLRLENQQLADEIIQLKKSKQIIP